MSQQDQDSNGKKSRSVEIVVLGLLAALLMVLAIPVLSGFSDGFHPKRVAATSKWF